MTEHLNSEAVSDAMLAAGRLAYCGTAGDFNECMRAAYLAMTAARPVDGPGEQVREALADPSAVHINMLRGSIARPTPRSIWHIYGRELLDAMPDDYRPAVDGDEVEREQ